MGYRLCVLRAPGTNCDKETAFAFESLGLSAEIVHVKKFMDGKNAFSRYDGLVIPGGFSFGDHVRAGALLGRMLKERFSDELLEFSEEGKPVLGICNGFQVLVECGLLPGPELEAALTTNLSSKFECRWTNLKVENTGCIFTQGLEDTITLPVAHGEGRFLVNPNDLKEIIKKKQVAFRYALETGGKAGGRYPENPNGALDDIAGICNQTGVVLGLMPHPERALYKYMHPRWTVQGDSSFGDGYQIFKNMVEYIKG